MKKLFLLKILFILAAGSVYSQTVFTPTGAKTIYDLQSVATPVHIIQDKTNPQRLHAVYTVSPYSDSLLFNQRTVQYYYSSNGGASWSIGASFQQLYKAAYPSISLLSNGNPLITMQCGNPQTTYTFGGVFFGSNIFVDLGNTTCPGRAPQIAAGLDLSNNRKYFILNSAGFSAGLSLTAPDYTACVSLEGLHPDAFSIARGSDGRIGIAYVVNPLQQQGNSGDVFFMQSIDNGVTFSTPVKIFDASIDENGRFNGGLRGISLVYNNNTPNVVFEITPQDIFGGYYVNTSAAILYWSPDNAGTGNQKCKYIARNDSASQIAYIPFYKAYGNDVLTSLCRPSIGTFSDSNYMAVVFMSATANVKIISADTVCYDAVYLTYTHNKGASWSKPKKITPDEIKDWTYPSISSYNFSSVLPYTANIVATKDSLPGSYFNNSFFGKTLAEQYFIKTQIGSPNEPASVTITSGKVRYNDNNDIVTTGVVKALRYNESTGEVIVMAQSAIDANGNYSLIFEPPYNTNYIVAYPNSEKTSDFVPTYFPQSIEWQLAQIVNSGGNNENIDIGVFRRHETDGPLSIAGYVNNNFSALNKGINEAWVYVKQSGSYVSFARTDCTGKYRLADFSPTLYQFTVTKLGYSTVNQNVPVVSSMDSLNFYLKVIISVHSASNEVPKNFNLYQNYPNPFNPSTKIKFDIPKKSFVTIKIFNVLGKEVGELLNENKAAGSYVAEFNGQGMTSGIYFYRLTTTEYSETKRMVIIK